MMRIQFESTVEDFVDAHERVLSRSRAARSWQREGAVTTAVLGGLIMSIPAFVFAFVIWPPALALAWTGVAAIGGAAISWNSHRKKVKQRLYNYFREQFGERESLPCEVELSDSGLSTRQMGVQNLFEWPNVEEMSELEDTIEFYVYGGGGVFVKKRYFASPEEQRQFLEAARHYLNVSRTSSNWRDAS
jgi:hypothetical protein